MNDENLERKKYRSGSEAREGGQKGGKASGESRRRKKSMKEVFRLVKDLPVKDEKLKAQLEAVGITDKDTTYASAMAWSTIYHAMKGNSQMMRLAFEMMGEDPAVKLKEEELRLRKKEMKARAADWLDNDLNITIVKKGDGDGA